jgi:hypothetical protein
MGDSILPGCSRRTRSTVATFRTAREAPAARLCTLAAATSALLVGVRGTADVASNAQAEHEGRKNRLDQVSEMKLQIVGGSAHRGLRCRPAVARRTRQRSQIGIVPFGRYNDGSAKQRADRVTRADAELAKSARG